MSAGAPAIDFAEQLIAASRRAESDDGTITLRWSPPDHGGTVEVQRAPGGEFARPIPCYTGTDPGSVLTGLPAGEHHFRIRAVDADGNPGAWSAPFTVRVVFMERHKVLWLLVGGGLIVLTTMGAILTGHFRGGTSA